MGKINKTTESRYFSELDSMGNKMVDLYGMKKNKDSWPHNATLRKIYEKEEGF